MGCEGTSQGESRRCTATSKHTGERCRQPAVRVHLLETPEHSRFPVGREEDPVDEIRSRQMQ